MNPLEQPMNRQGVEANYRSLMENNTSWTPSSEDNLLGISDKNIINEFEAKGIAAAELFIFELDTETILSAQLILKIHRIAFAELYEWAGKWRTINVIVGQLEPPATYQVPQLIYQFADNLNFKISIAESKQDHVECLIYAHYNFICIHPFNNGNGRIGRILMNLVAMKLGYRPLTLYYKEGNSRRVYINALRLADKGNFEELIKLINEEVTSF